jgi:hypothetical protein
MTVGLHRPPAVKVGAGVFVWCRELYGLDEVQRSLGPMYEKVMWNIISSA